MAQGKVTVFGGTGFLGQRVVQHLLERDFSVRVAARHPERIAPLFPDVQLEAIHGDVNDDRSVAAAVPGLRSDRIHHAAARDVDRPVSIIEIDVKRLDLRRPMLGKSVFDAAADRPADVARGVAAVDGGAVEPAISDTAGDVYQGAIETANEAACLVLDIRLGEISGIELGLRLAASGYRLPIIFITAVDSSSAYEDAMETGCVAYLRKPFPARELIGAIAAATA